MLWKCSSEEWSDLSVCGWSVWRLNADEQIQMVTALALQLIQCVVKLPSHINCEELQSNDLDDVGSAKKKNDFVRVYWATLLLNFLWSFLLGISCICRNYDLVS